MFEKQAKLLREARNQQGLSQAKLYYAIFNVKSKNPSQFISNIERGIAGIPLDALPAFCKVLAIPKKQMIETLIQDYRTRLGGHFD